MVAVVARLDVRRAFSSTTKRRLSPRAEDASMATSVKRAERAMSKSELTGGGPEGNEQLTSWVGLVLIPLLMVIAVTIVQIRQLIWLHLFLGVLLIAPVLAKTATTGYRFFRYYTHDAVYRRKGPPELWLRLSAPILVLTTAVVFVTGVILLYVGPADRGQLVEIHKVSFIVWAVFFVLHLLGHVPGLPKSLRAVRLAHRDLSGSAPGEAGRWITLAGTLVAGLVLAVVLIPQFHAWTAAGALPHHHHG
jgi:hypothetical protein